MCKYVDLDKKTIKCGNCGGETFTERAVHIDSPTQSISADDLVPEIRDDAHTELRCTKCNLARTHHTHLQPLTD